MNRVFTDKKTQPAMQMKGLRRNEAATSTKAGIKKHLERNTYTAIYYQAECHAGEIGAHKKCLPIFAKKATCISSNYIPAVLVRLLIL